MSFLRRKKQEPAPPPPPPTPVQEEVVAQEYQLRIALVARSSDGLRLPADPRVAASLAGIVEPLSQTKVETIPPLPLEYSDASPAIERFNEVQQWVLARREVSPIARHGLYVLEMTDALDMTVDTFVCGLLHGDTDTSGYPEYNAIVGGLATHWDELSGELIVRAVIGWGGKGLRGGTERIGAEDGQLALPAGARFRLQPWRGRAGTASLDRPPIGPDVRALRVRGRQRQRLLLPEVRHAHAAGLNPPRPVLLG